MITREVENDFIKFWIEDDILYFCSERQIMQEALEIKSSSKRGFNTGESSYHYYQMENNHGLILNREGVESYRRYSAKDWWSRERSYGRHDIDLLRVQCPACLSQTKYYDGLYHNKCEVCGAEITEEDLYDLI